MKLPNFLIAGASKTGSTTLHYILNQHPEITIIMDFSVFLKKSMHLC